MAELKYWVWLASVTGLGALTCKKLLDRFASPDRVFYADEQEYDELDFLTKDAKAALMKKDLHRAVSIIDDSLRRGWTVLTVSDAIYPERLRCISDPPIVLYVRGRLPAMDQEVAVAVVGTRNCTDYGRKSARRIGNELARCGCVVVTGLAKGIDTAAAKGALYAGGRVIGVLGCGLDVIYPRENEALYDAVAENGALVTEYPPGTPPASGNFPVRNRIISGLSLGVTVVEAPLRSGASITAGLALDQGKDVFVVPGNIDSYASQGSNRLLREGAYAVTGGVDIAAEYERFYPNKIRLIDDEQLEKPTPEEQKAPSEQPAEEVKKRTLPDDLTEEQKRICKALLDGPKHVDEIIEAASLPAGEVTAQLTMMQIEELIISQDGNYFRLA